MSRNTPSPKILELAQQLLDRETVAENPSEVTLPPVFRVVEKLRRPLVTLAGIAGFCSLLARALTLAKAQVPRLRAVQIDLEAGLNGLGDLGNQDQAAEAGVMLIAELLGLLETFIGQSLMLSLARDAWPDLPILDEGSMEKK